MFVLYIICRLNCSILLQHVLLCIILLTAHLKTEGLLCLPVRMLLICIIQIDTGSKPYKDHICNMFNICDFTAFCFVCSIIIFAVFYHICMLDIYSTVLYSVCWKLYNRLTPSLEAMGDCSLPTPHPLAPSHNPSHIKLNYHIPEDEKEGEGMAWGADLEQTSKVVIHW